MSKRIDLTGKIFGHLLVIESAPLTTKHRRWLCQCDCGDTTAPLGINLVRGFTQSCGCRKGSLRHGQAKKNNHSLAHNSWTMMKQRCQNPRATQYADYGGRGIKVCERWQLFDNFFADMGERPQGSTLDRENNNGNYEPGNCKWATRAEQDAHKRHKKSTLTDDEKKRNRKIAKQKSYLKHRTLKHRFQNDVISCDQRR